MMRLVNTLHSPHTPLHSRPGARTVLEVRVSVPLDPLSRPAWPPPSGLALFRAPFNPFRIPTTLLHADPLSNPPPLLVP